MKRENISDALNLLDDEMIRHTEMIRGRANHSKKTGRQKWVAAAACLCLVFVMGVFLSRGFQNPSQMSHTPENLPSAEPDKFVSISSLLAEHGAETEEMAEETATVPVEQYQGIYEKTASVESDILSESLGAAVSGTEEWYAVLGHTDLQYLIREDGNAYSLWKFKCFDSEEYSYGGVLKLVYGIESAEKITEIQVNPATMDNTDAGRNLQEEIGTRTVTDRGEIGTVYQILSSLICYGENHWDMIDYGNVEAAADDEPSSGEAVRLGRYLTLITSYGNEIDGLKYTAVSDMFYEFSGIAYEKLTEEQADSVCRILGIERSGGRQVSGNGDGDSATVDGTDDFLSAGNQSDGGAGAAGDEMNHGDITLEYITELQNKISDAMSKQELPFVSSSAVYVNPYRLRVVVSSKSEEDLAKLEAFDTIGGALEIVYSEEENGGEALE